MSEPLENGVIDDCASGHPEWVPSSEWTPEFEDLLLPEEYDGN